MNQINVKQIIVSAGDAITAKLVEEAGFDGIWISGFEASARLGLPDNGSITMTEMLNVARVIVKSVKIPVWVDTDTGYGNFKRTVREFEDIGVTGICVEDNMPNKQNSLWGGQTELMNMSEFGKKISVKRNKIKIMARTEALVREYGMIEAILRLAHYKSCGADVILPHTRIKQYAQAWKHNGCLTAIVPTKFPEVTNKELHDMGYNMVIWANQTERVKIKATRDALQTLKDYDSALHIEDKLSAALDDMKGLTPND